MASRLIQADAVKWAREFATRMQIEKPFPPHLFHALLCDPPYELKFMGRDWDSTGVSFRAETWRAFRHIMHPGAFGMAFSSARGFHRMAVAIEDAGFRIHPMIGWVYGSGFPKATRVKDSKEFQGHRYGLQALKPALEPIIVFQKPYEHKPLDDIVTTGAGALWIDGSRISIDLDIDDKRLGGKGDWSSEKMAKNVYEGGYAGERVGSHKNGRWPANLVITHYPDCRVVGTQDDDYQINRFTDGAKPFGDGAGHEFVSESIEGTSIVWECVEGCPVRAMNEQSGKLKSGKFADHHRITSEWGYHGGERDVIPRSATYGDTGGAARFFHQSQWNFENVDPFLYQAKAAKKERNAGLDNTEYIVSDGREKSIDNAYLRGETKWHNPHPTIKPIALTKHLASLLLPPAEYAPRNLFVPFAGVASEMIGALLAGWDAVTGIELQNEYIEIGNARINHWIKKVEETK